MSNRISSFFVANNIIKQEDTEVYEYSLEVFFSTIFNFLAVAIIAVFTKNIWETVIYLLAFIPLRLIAGGYHAKTHLRCFLVLIIMYTAFLLILNFIEEGWILYTVPIITIISMILIIILAPVGDKNKPLSAKEKKSFRKKSHITIIFYTAFIFFLLYFISNKFIALSLALGVLSIALSLLAAVIRNKITKEDINA